MEIKYRLKYIDISLSSEGLKYASQLSAQKLKAQDLANRLEAALSNYLTFEAITLICAYLELEYKYNWAFYSKEINATFYLKLEALSGVDPNKFNHAGTLAIDNYITIYSGEKDVQLLSYKLDESRLTPLAIRNRYIISAYVGARSLVLYKDGIMSKNDWQQEVIKYLRNGK